MRSFSELAVLSAINIFLVYFLGSLPVPAAVAALLATMIVNCVFTRHRGAAAGFAATVLTAVCLWALSYVAQYAFYFGSAGSWSWLAITAAGLAASYLDSNPYIFFVSLLCGLNLSLNLYVEVLNVNPFSPEFLRLPESSHMASVLLPVLILAFYHRAEGRRQFSNSALVVFLIGLALFVFLRNMEMDVISSVYAGAGFLAAFAVYFMFPQRDDKARRPASGEEDDAGIFASLLVPCFNVRQAPFTAQVLLLTAAAAITIFGAAWGRQSAEIEAIASGAALYTDDMLGYVARFRLPFEAIILPGGSEDQKKLKNLQNAVIYKKEGWAVCPPGGVPPGAGIRLVATLRDVASVPGGGAAALLEFPCATTLVTPDRLSSISPNFVYRLRIGVSDNGANYLKSFELLGDKFVMFDDEAVYNKYKTDVKNFFAISNSGHAAIYDFSGKLRIVGPGSSATAMILTDLAGMRAVAPAPEPSAAAPPPRAAGEGGFLILTSRELLLVQGRTISRIALPGNKSFGPNLDMTSGPGGVIVTRSGGAGDENAGGAIASSNLAATIVKNTGGRYSAFPLEKPIKSGLSCAYFDGKTAVWSDYFSESVIFAEYVEKDRSYREIRRREVLIGNPVFVRAAPTAENRITVASYRDRDSSFDMTEFDTRNFEITSRFIIKNSTGTQVDDFAFAADGNGIIAACGNFVSEFGHGFFIDRVKSVSLPGSGNEYRPTAPLKIAVSGDRVHLLKDNSYFICDRKKSSVERFEYAR